MSAAADIAAAAAAVLDAFRREIEAGALKPAQHASLLLLDQLLTASPNPAPPFAGAAAGRASPCARRLLKAEKA